MAIVYCPAIVLNRSDTTNLHVLGSSARDFIIFYLHKVIHDYKNITEYITQISNHPRSFPSLPIFVLTLWTHVKYLENIFSSASNASTLLWSVCTRSQFAAFK